MSPRNLSLAMVVCLVLTFAEGRAVKENRQKRQIAASSATPTNQRCSNLTITDDIGEIDIGNGNSYYDNEDCCFTFEPEFAAGSEFTIDLEFNEFDIESGNFCNYDYISYGTSDGNRERDCGTKDSFPYIRSFVSTGSFEMCFHSDQSVRQRGANLYYYVYPGIPDSVNFTTVSPPEDVISPVNSTTPSVNVTSPPMNSTTPPVNATSPPVNATFPAMNVTMPNFNQTTPGSNFTVFTTLPAPTNSSGNNTSCNRYLTGLRGHITSPGFNNSYPNRQDCNTTIRGLNDDMEYIFEVRFSKFDIEHQSRCIYDYLQFSWSNNQSQKLCGDDWRNRTLRFNVRGGDVSAHFHSDGSVTREGFFATYHIRPSGVPRNASNCTFYAHGRHGMIQSLPGNGSNYENNLNCNYSFDVPNNHALHLNFTTFDLESGSTCPYDYVQIDGGRKWCGTVMDERRVNRTGQVNLLFHTDSSVTRRGFVAYYTIRAENGTIPPANTTYPPMNTTYIPINTTYSYPLNTTYIPINTTATPFNTSCNRYLTGLRGHITSPGFNNSYPNRQDCNTTIRGLNGDMEYIFEVRFSKFDIEYESRCIFDYLQFSWSNNQSQKLCGDDWRNRTFRFNVRGGDVSAHFHSDGSVTREGFFATYHIRPSGVPRNASNCTFYAHGRHGMIQSLPGNGSNYENNLNCNYIFDVPNIHALHLNFTTFDLESGSTCPYDYVQIDGGRKWCGTVMDERRVNTTGQVRLLFHTDGSVVRRGFVAYYTIRAINGTFPPANTTYPPMNTTYYPVNTTYPPFNTTYYPVNTTYLPFNTTYYPVNTTYSYPVNSTYIPFNTTAFPTNTTGRPLNDCNYDSNALEGSYTLPTNAEGFYGNNERCVINLRSEDLPHVTYINFTDFDVEYNADCDYDALEISLGNSSVETMCGNNMGSTSKQYSTAEPTVHMEFTSDSSVRGKGFAFIYRTEYAYCDVTINGTSGSFASSPAAYYNNMNCTYTINTPGPVRLFFTFPRFDVEYAMNCGYDAVIMGEERLCGRSQGPKEYVSNGTFVIRFTTDSSVTWEGFYMSFTSDPLFQA